MNKKVTLGHPTVLKLKEFQATLADGPLYQMVGRLATAPQKYTSVDAVLGEFRQTLKECKRYDHDQRLALVGQLEVVLALVRIEGSDGLLDAYLDGILL